MRTPKGFTLIEILVSVAIFSIVMVIALGALLAMSESDRKAQTLKSVINNLNFALDSMSRSIRTGQNYHCDVAQSPITAPRDCSNSSAGSVVFKAADGTTVIYRLESVDRTLCAQPSGTVGCIVRSTDSGLSYFPVTAPEVVVSSLQFFVTGAQNAALQPKVTMLLGGAVTVSGSQNSAFNLQTSVTQRIYDQ